jgi:meso-butanediol dehydrogenase/(S,S)-butanediol dehydrogenase/diacetyl reductase
MPQAALPEDALPEDALSEPARGRLLGRVAVITGAGRGIGRAIALRLARDGADVALVDITAAGIGAVAAEVAETGAQVTTFVADVSDRDQVFAAVDHATAALGGLDVMVNNAGIAIADRICDATRADGARMWAVNVEGVLWGIQAAAAKFISLDRPGKIINASSVAGHEGFAMLGLYSATKFAVRALTQTAAKEYAAQRITVNAYCPGIVDTDMWADIDRRFAETTGAAVGETFTKHLRGVALRRAETPADVAGFVAYLAGPDADYMTGQAGLIDGGLVYR